MKILNDSEHRIFLSAMSRERKVCKSEEFYDYDGTNKLLDICDSIERKINDAVPVVHGHWIKNEGAGWNCSHCHKDDCYAFLYNFDTEVEDIQDNYCPNCGAKMDGERKEDDITRRNRGN